MIMDATWATTPDFPPRDDWGGDVHPPAVTTSEKVRKLIEKRWEEYGIGYTISYPLERFK